MRQKGVGGSEQRFFIDLAGILMVHGNAAIEILAIAAEKQRIALQDWIRGMRGIFEGS
jgi:hypothetical protein